MIPNPEPMLKEQWEHISRSLIQDLSEDTYASWIQPLKLVGIQNQSIIFHVPSLFMKNWVLTHYVDKILKQWLKAIPHLKSIELVVNHEVTTEEIVPLRDEAPVTLPTKSPLELDKEGLHATLDGRFTFESFVVGKPNELAYAAAVRVAEALTPPFNPLFLYGGVGLGKTHLMHAIAWRIRQIQPKRKVMYVSAEKFMYQFIRSVRYKDTVSFKDQFRSVDVLMIDDVQFMGGKDTTQEEFFHTFNALVDNNRQVILSADKSPSDLEKVEERLRSRLGWGLVADIHPTTYELRLSILEAKAEMLNIYVSRDVKEFLASRIVSNIRELEGALNRMAAHAMLIGQEVTLDIAQELLRDLLRSHERLITIEDIQRKVCEYYRIKMSDLLSDRRIKTLARPRQIAVYLSKILTTRSLPEIGRKFGGRDHTTVLHAVRKIQELLTKDPEMENDIKVLRKSVESA